MPRATLIRLVLAVLVITAVTSAVMVPIDWNGEAASSAADPIDTLLDVMIVLSAFVFAIVMVMLGYSVWRYRAKPGDESDGAPVHGNTKLEVLWTLIPTVIVLFGAAYSWIILDDIEAREKDKMVVDVRAQQFAWSFTYPEQQTDKVNITKKFTTTALHVPVDQEVEFRLHALDVLHSFWVPEWRIKKDAVPGAVTHALVEPDKEGRFTLLCTELCGLGHGTMRAPVKAESPEEFSTWVADNKAGPPANGKSAGAKTGGRGGGPGTEVGGGAGKKIFVGQGCSSCHTLKAAGSEAEVGPNLDEVLRGKDEDFIRTSIIDPGDEVASGFSDGIMPRDFKEKIKGRQLDDLVEFLFKSTNGKR